MRDAGRIVAFAVQEAAGAVEPGISTRELDAIARRVIEAHRAKPAFLGLYGFPATACISVNDEIVHGIPGDRVIREGDIVSFDCGAIVDGWNSDMAVTLVAGSGGEAKARLIAACRSALEEGVANALPGNRVGDISHAIENRTVSLGFEPVREYTGHGIGRRLHEPPDVPNFGPAGKGPLLRDGMFLAIEPIICAGNPETELLEDDWTVVSADGSLSAHFEHTVAITADGPVVLTALPG
jgi:methionyl aminopeptidase